MQRRTLLRSFGVGLTAGALSSAGALPGLQSAATAATAQWPGHQPGRVYVGASNPNFSSLVAQISALGLHRAFCRWDNLTDEINKIKSDHAARRLPWTSYTSPDSWSRVASGAHDAQIRQRARAYAALSRPVISTFCHEPQTELNHGTPAEWAAAWIRVHDVMEDETGLANVALVPIIGDWVFNPYNRRDEPVQYLLSGVLSRMAFLGVDIYQNPSGQTYADRLPRVLDFLESHGAGNKMIGIGETGCTDYYSGTTAVQWWNESWAWVVANRNKVAALSYYDSSANSRPGVYWPLNESAAKRAAYEAAVRSSTACRLP